MLIRCLIMSLVSLLLSIALAQAAVDRPSRDKYSGRSKVLAANGMVAISRPLASPIGLDVLKRGGTAVDAALAANTALGLMEPYACGIGGICLPLCGTRERTDFMALTRKCPSPVNGRFIPLFRGL